MSLKDVLKESLLKSMRSGDKLAVGTIRLVNSEIKKQEIDKQVVLDDHGILAILSKMSNQHLESIAQFDKAGRHDLVEKEQAELEIIKLFLPKPLTQEETETIILEVMAELKPTSIKDLGTVISHLKPKLAGRANMKFVSEFVKSKLMHS